MAHGPFNSVAEKRAREMATNRAASLDHAAAQKIQTPPTHHSSDAIATAAAVVCASARSKINSPALNYFRPAHSEIRFGKLRFLITDRPSERNVDGYVAELERYRAAALVRVCEPTYATEPLKERGIIVEDWEFTDGSPPPDAVIAQWLKLCTDVFGSADTCVAVHCVSGLGRAPVLVGIALLEAGMKCEDAIFLIRSQRRGALNETQLEFLRQYRPAGRLRKFRFVEREKERKSCAIM